MHLRCDRSAYQANRDRSVAGESKGLGEFKVGLAYETPARGTTIEN